MDKINDLIFPDQIYFENYSGNFEKYFEAVYTIFKHDFIKKQPLYDDKKVTVRRYPEVEGIHRTFYHITHEGEDESNRIPDLRRMERIKFPKFVIENCPHFELYIWEKKFGKDIRIHVLNEKEQYIVVFEKRKSYFILITAFYIDKSHTLKKKLKEYEAYIKAKTA